MRECLVPVCARAVRVRVCAHGMCACVCSVRAFACACACLSTCLYLLCALCECTVCACACTGKARGTSCGGSRGGQMLLADAWPVLSYKAYLCARLLSDVRCALIVRCACARINVSFSLSGSLCYVLVRALCQCRIH